MAPQRLGIFALVTSLILLTCIGYSHRPISLVETFRINKFQTFQGLPLFFQNSSKTFSVVWNSRTFQDWPWFQGQRRNPESYYGWCERRFIACFYMWPVCFWLTMKLGSPYWGHIWLYDLLLHLLNLRTVVWLLFRYRTWKFKTFG